MSTNHHHHQTDQYFQRRKLSLAWWSSSLLSTLQLRLCITALCLFVFMFLTYFSLASPCVFVLSSFVLAFVPLSFCPALLLFFFSLPILYMLLSWTHPAGLNLSNIGTKTIEISISIFLSSMTRHTASWNWIMFWSHVFYLCHSISPCTSLDSCLEKFNLSVEQMEVLISINLISIKVIINFHRTTKFCIFQHLQQFFVL